MKTGIIIWLIVIILYAVGWIGNIVKLCHNDFEAPYKSEVIRGCGVVVGPVGAIVGYMDIGGRR